MRTHRFLAQLCYAFRRWNDIGVQHLTYATTLLTAFCVDTARDIYQNASLEKLAFLQHVNAREASLRKAEENSRAILQVRCCHNTNDFSCAHDPVEQEALHGVAELRTAATDAHMDSQQLIRAMSAGVEQVDRTTCSAFAVNDASSGRVHRP